MDGTLGTPPEKLRGALRACASVLVDHVTVESCGRAWIAAEHCHQLTRHLSLDDGKGPRVEQAPWEPQTIELRPRGSIASVGQGGAMSLPVRPEAIFVHGVRLARRVCVRGIARD